MARKPEKSTEVPPFVSLRFLALAVGLPYPSATALAGRSGIRTNKDRLRNWSDVQRSIPKRLVGEAALKLLARHARPTLNETTPIEVPGEVYRAVRDAWRALNAPGCPLLITRDDIDAIPEDLPTTVKLDLVRLKTQEEALRYKKLVGDRLSAMMCDRMSVESGCRQAILIIQRWMRNLPTRFTGILLKSSAISDAELRMLEKLIQDELPIVLREVRRAFEAIPAESSGVAATQRYASRNWSMPAGSA